MSIRNRRTYHPEFYRVMIATVAGWVSRDAQSLDQARKIAKIETTPGWSRPYILACWSVEGSRTLDTERVS